jgi:SWI/SNF-related matrix-associated actin-dependent regulator 1 of chromatin subfamily A
MAHPPPQTANHTPVQPIIAAIPRQMPTTPQSLTLNAPKQVSPIQPPNSVVAAPVAPITRDDIGGSTTVQIELSYGGRSRVRVTIFAVKPVALYSGRGGINLSVSNAGPIITQSNLPQSLKDAISRVAQGQNCEQWDTASEPGTWPLYEESRIDLASKESSILAHWLFPTRVLAQIEMQMRRAMDFEIAAQAHVSPSQRVTIRFIGLNDYVRRLIIECNRIYRAADQIATSTPVGPPSALDISSIIPPDLLERDLFQALKDYQVKGVEYAYCRNGRLLLADAPGLGKTIQAIAMACCYERDWPVLVICPSSVRAMWADEFQRWVPHLSLHEISTNFTGKKTSLTAKVNIISYELLKSAKIMDSVWTISPTEERTHPFGVVICDECHLLKSWKSIRAQAIIPIVQRAKRAILLSGTPATSKPSELHTQLSCVLPNVFRHFPSFGDRYCDPKPQPFGRGMDYSGASNLQELHLLLTESLMIRRQKAEVLGNMPSKRRHQLLLTIPKEQQKMLISMAKELAKLSQSLASSSGSKRKPKKTGNNRKGAKLAMDEAEEAEEDFSGLDVASLRGRQRTVVLELFQNAGRAKLPSAIAHLEECLKTSAPDTKYLVFGHHLDVLDGFSHALHAKGIEYIRIDGKTQSTQRQPLVDHFQSTPSCRVAILSILAAGVGITLTKASKVFFAELYWDPSTLLQAEDRAHRFGQDKDVDVFYMIAKGSYDEKLWEAVDSKLSVLSAVLDDKKAQFKLDSVSKSSSAASSLSTDSFIQYLIQKVDGYAERSEEATERALTRTKARNGTLDLDEDFPYQNNDQNESVSPQKTRTLPQTITLPQQPSHYETSTNSFSSSSGPSPQKSLHLSSATPSKAHTPKASSPTAYSPTSPDPKKRQLHEISKPGWAFPPTPLEDEDSFEAAMSEPPIKKQMTPGSSNGIFSDLPFASHSLPKETIAPSSRPLSVPSNSEELARKRAAKFKMFEADES